MVILLVLGAGGFVRGMTESLKRAGDSTNVLVMGIGSEESIELSRQALQPIDEFRASASSRRAGASEDAVAIDELADRLDAHRALEVDVELDLRQLTEIAHAPDGTRR